jgi:AcrR family transcriptional regulator
MTSSTLPQSSGGRLYGGESHAERAARRRQQFLDAGLQVFGTTGYRTATVRQLCKHAALTDRYFYESFENTEDLLIAVYTTHFVALAERVQTAVVQGLAAGSPMAAVRAGLDAVFQMVEDPRVARACWLEILGVSPRVDAVYCDTFERFAQLLVDFTMQAYPQSRLDPAEAKALGITLVGAISQSITHSLLAPQSLSRDTLVQANLRVFQGVMLTLA